MRLLTPTQRARAAQVLGFDVEDTEWRIPEPVQRELAARFGDGDLLATRTESELVAAAERGDFDAAYYLRALALARGDEEQADHWLARARQIDPLELETRSALMWARLHPDDREGSAARLMSAVAKGSPSALFGLGVAAYQRGRRELAERLWERAAELGSNDALVDLAVLHGERGDLDQAIRWATTASERGHPAGFELRAHIAEVRHRDDEAEPLLLRALELGSTKAVRQLAALRIRQGRHDEAVEVLVSAAGRGNADAAHLLAVLSDSPSDEHRWLRRAAELGHGRAAGSLGLSLIGPDHALEAELLLRKAVRLEEPVGGAGLAALYLGLGEVGEAERWFAWTLERGDEEAIETALAAAHHMGPPGMFERWQQTARQA
jgi:TPR repeat protein